jgi:hypothetical protein
LRGVPSAHALLTASATALSATFGGNSSFRTNLFPFGCVRRHAPFVVRVWMSSFAQGIYTEQPCWCSVLARSPQRSPHSAYQCSARCRIWLGPPSSDLYTLFAEDPSLSRPNTSRRRVLGRQRASLSTAAVLFDNTGPSNVNDLQFVAS